jgi:hypothetical protein
MPAAGSSASLQIASINNDLSQTTAKNMTNFEHCVLPILCTVCIMYNYIKYNYYYCCCCFSPLAVVSYWLFINRAKELYQVQEGG